MQTKTWQRKIIDAAKQKGELCTLFWFVNVAVPGRYYDDRKAREQPAMFPGRYVPVIRIGPDDIESRHHAETLAEIFAFVNRGRGFTVGVDITDAAMLGDGWQWYEWGSVTWDCVCGVCGGVFADTSPQLDICEECRREASCEGIALADNCTSSDRAGDCAESRVERRAVADGS